MQIRLKSLAVCLLIPLLVGGISAIFNTSAMKEFENLNQPALSPPAIVFPIVWTVLYILMGIASYIVCDAGISEIKRNSALTFYGLQLFFNFAWSFIFFTFGLYLFAFFWLIALFVLVLITACKFYKISKPAGLLFVPYVIWLIIAGYLNIMIYVLN